MKIWIDDVRPAPKDYIWCKTVNEATTLITCITRLYDMECTDNLPVIELLDLDHDAGDYASFGGDYIRVLDFMEKNGYSYPIRIHSMNVVGRQNMLAICERNGWTVIR